MRYLLVALWRWVPRCLCSLVWLVRVTPLLHITRVEHLTTVPTQVDHPFQPWSLLLCRWT